MGDFYQSIPEAGNDGCSCLFAMNEKGEQYIKGLDGVVVPTDYKTIGSVNGMLWKSVNEHPRRNEFFTRFQSDTFLSETLFTDFLPFRFKIKKVLNKCGLFSVVRKILKG